MLGSNCEFEFLTSFPVLSSVIPLAKKLSQIEWPNTHAKYKMVSLGWDSYSTL